MSNPLLRIGLPVVILGAAVAGYMLYRGKQDATSPVSASGVRPEAGPLPVYTFKAEPRLLRERVTATGTILAEEAIDLTAEIAGKVVEVAFEEGGRVSKGDVLVKINDSELQAELARTIHRVELAKLQARRQQQLFDVQGTSREALDAALNEQRVLEAEVELIRAQLDKMQIRAPFDGVVGLRHVSVGAFLNPSARVATLQDLGTLKIEFAVAERHMNRLRTGAEVRFGVAGVPGTFPATVYAIEPRIDLATRTVRLRARAANPDNAILPGAFASVDVALGEIPDALVVPTSAIIPGLREKTLYVIENGRAQPRTVETGLRLDSEIQILSGLEPGSVVITSGQLQLRPGLPVEPADDGLRAAATPSS
jgi:membrane fusion protein (multidrug efflux system)